MGYVPLPPPPFPPNATEEQKLKIMQEYRDYLQRSLDRTNDSIRWSLLFLIVVAIVVAAVVLL